MDHGYAITGHKTQGLTGDDFGVRPSTRADAHWSYVAASRHRFDLRLYLVEELDRPADGTSHTLDPLDDRVAATVRAMGALDPPAWLTGLLGEMPEAGRGRRAWHHTAARLHNYRDSYQLRDPQRALGQEPTGDLTQRRAWRAARQASDCYRRQHRTRERRHQRPHERDPTSTRTRAQARDREREAG